MTTPTDFPWRAGMRILPNDAGGGRYARILRMDDEVATVIAVEMPVACSREVGPWIEAWNEHADTDEDMPDEDDPATLGALLGAVREAYGDAAMYLRPTLYGWTCFNEVEAVVANRATEFEALLAAWNARPVKP